ncbi:hypothetical protein ACA30_02420 [Virgibacillus soli]|nr:hypothetical protein ACA30_02420 [Virgibacillus soli]
MPSHSSNFIGYLGCSFIPLGIGLLIFLISIGQFGVGIVLLIIFLVISIAFMARASEIEDANRERFKNYIASFRPKRKSFKETEVVSPDSLLTRIALDEQEKLLCIWLPFDMNKPIKEMSFDVLEYDFNNVSDVKMIINDQIAQNKEPEKISTLKLEISVPEKTHTLVFFDSTFESVQTQLTRGTSRYRSRLQCLKDGFALVEKLIVQTSEWEDERGFDSAPPVLPNEESQETVNDDPGEGQEQGNIIHLEEDPFARFAQALSKIKVKPKEEASVQDFSLDQPNISSDEEPVHDLYEDLFGPHSIQTKENETSFADLIHRHDELRSEPNALDKDLSQISFDDTSSSHSTEQEDSFSDFEKFLERNKQKQHGAHKKKHP